MRFPKFTNLGLNLHCSRFHLLISVFSIRCIFVSSSNRRSSPHLRPTIKSAFWKSSFIISVVSIISGQFSSYLLSLASARRLRHLRTVLVGHCSSPGSCRPVLVYQCLRYELCGLDCVVGFLGVFVAWIWYGCFPYFETRRTMFGWGWKRSRKRTFVLTKLLLLFLSFITREGKHRFVS